MVLAFPYSGSLSLVMFVAWVPLLFIESKVTRQRYKSGKVFIHAYWAFLIFNIGTTWWVWFTSDIGSILAFLANSLLMTLAFYAFHLTKRHVGTKEGYVSLLIYWIGFEYLHYNWEGSWTWLTIGNVFSEQPSWIQWYSYSGAMGGTLWVLIVNLFVFRIYENVLVRNESWRIQTPLIWLGSLAVIIPMCISLGMYFNYEEKKDPVDIVVIQPNIDPYNEKFSGNVEDQIDKIMALAKKKTSKSTDLVLAPETAVYSLHECWESQIPLYPWYRRLQEWQTEMDEVTICIGVSTAKRFNTKVSRAAKPFLQEPGFYEQYNTSMLLKSGVEPKFVHKSKLVPGVESIPLSKTFPFLEELAIQNGGTSGTLGVENGPKIFDAGGFKFAPVVCYESIYGEWVAEQCRMGAEIICIGTNDGWWGDTPGYKQHMSFARIRAIENRRCVARSANTGTSGFINQRGDVIAASNWWEQDVMKQRLNLNSEQTFYTRYGNVMGRSFSFFGILLLLFTFVKRFRKRVGK